MLGRFALGCVFFFSPVILAQEDLGPYSDWFGAAADITDADGRLIPEGDDDTVPPFGDDVDLPRCPPDLGPWWEWSWKRPNEVDFGYNGNHAWIEVNFEVEIDMDEVTLNCTVDVGN